MTFKVVVPATFLRQASGLRGLRPTNTETALFEQAMDYMFTEAQRRVHVLSGDLKASGDVDPVRVDGDRLVGGISYGGGSVDYAKYEFGRGGSHDPIRPALAASQRVFEQAVLDAARSMVARAVSGGV